MLFACNGDAGGYAASLGFCFCFDWPAAYSIKQDLHRPIQRTSDVDRLELTYMVVFVNAECAGEVRFL